MGNSHREISDTPDFTTMAFSTVLVIKDPLNSCYKQFFNTVFESLSPSLPGIDVYIAQHIENANELGFVLQEVYGNVRNEALNRGFPFDFEINVLWNSPKKDWFLSYRPSNEEAVADISEMEISSEPSGSHKESLKLKPDSFKYQQFVVSAVGGTFDHLHDGHKILLLMAAFVTRKHLIVGVTGPGMLKNKKFAEAMEPIEARVKAVSRYLQETLPGSVTYSVYQIDDVCGPTGYVRDIDALVISEETKSGADFVNDYRKKQGFSELAVVTIDLLEAPGVPKVSSTDMREQELKRSAAKKNREL